jgi:hypothetical protein
MDSQQTGKPYRWEDRIDPIVYLCTIQADPVLIPGSTRITLARLFGQLGYRTGAEIGVGSGPYSEVICLHNPGVKLFAVDAWKPYPEYRDFTNADNLQGDRAMALIRLAPYSVTIIRQFSAEAARQFDDSSLDFVYIDANHDSPYIDEDIRLWAPKVRVGGIVSGHDYMRGHPDVMRAVNNYTAAHGIRPFYLVGNPGETNDPDTICSWFWRQP